VDAAPALRAALTDGDERRARSTVDDPQAVVARDRNLLLTAV